MVINDTVVELVTADELTHACTVCPCPTTACRTNAPPFTLMRVLEIPPVTAITGTVPSPLSVMMFDDTDVASDALTTLVKSNAAGTSSTPLPVIATPFTVRAVVLITPVVEIPGTTSRPTVSK